MYMEALIMEVQVSKDFGLGVQYGGSGTFADETGTLFGGFSGESGDNAYGILGGAYQRSASPSWRLYHGRFERRNRNRRLFIFPILAQ